MKNTLLVIVPDRLSDLVVKGEVIDRYYNPGNLFEEVHILMTNDDTVDPEDVQKTVGRARLYLHNLPAPSFKKTLGWRPLLLRSWAKRALKLAKQIKPVLIRCHGNQLNGLAAVEIKVELKIPYVVSIHNQPDEDKKIFKRDLQQKIKDFLGEDVARIGIQKADVVMPVYKSIVPYLERRGVKNLEVIYNILNERLKKKEEYRLSAPVKILSVGHQIPEKNPDQLIRAIAQLKNSKLTIVGNGVCHQYLKSIVKNCEFKKQVEFIPAIPNDRLCDILPEFDIFATHSYCCGIPKTVMEALVTGLPVVVNKPDGNSIPEYGGDFLILVENTVGGYYHGLKKLIEDDNFREQLGRRAYVNAQKEWAPDKMEKKIVDLYKRLVPGL